MELFNLLSLHGTDTAVVPAAVTKNTPGQAALLARLFSRNIWCLRITPWTRSRTAMYEPCQSLASGVGQVCADAANAVWQERSRHGTIGAK